MDDVPEEAEGKPLKNARQGGTICEAPAKKRQKPAPPFALLGGGMDTLGADGRTGASDRRATFRWKTRSSASRLTGTLTGADESLNPSHAAASVGALC